MKKSANLLVVITRFFVLLATVVAMGVVTFNVGKVLVTQFRLASIYFSIESAENARTESAAKAQDSLGSGVRGYYQNQADGYDEEVERLTQKRYDIMHSDDAIIAWSAKDGFEYSIFFLSLAAMAIIGLLWVQWYKHMQSVTEFEEMVLYFIIASAFNGLSILLSLLGKSSYKASYKSKSHFFALYKKRSNRKTKKSRKTHRPKSNIISIDTKKRIG